MTKTITQEIVSNIRPYEDEERIRLTLNPSTLTLRESFRDELVRRINAGNINELPWIRRLENETTLDSSSIINLNNQTTLERREELLNQIISHENGEENLNLIVNSSSDIVRSYINSLLIRFHNHENLSEVDFYRIGNILLYYVSNIELNGIEISQLMGSFRNVMFEYNQQQMIPSFINEIINNSNETLDQLGLLTEQQLQERADEFHQQVEEHRLIAQRRRLMVFGIGVLGSMALTSMGLPPVGSLFIRSITNTMPVSTNSVEDIIRFRDVWDASLKKMLDIIKK